MLFYSEYLGAIGVCLTRSPQNFISIFALSPPYTTHVGTFHRLEGPANARSIRHEVFLALSESPRRIAIVALRLEEFDKLGRVLIAEKGVCRNREASEGQTHRLDCHDDITGLASWTG